MKNLPLILSIVALLAVAPLYVMQFSKKTDATGQAVIVPPASVSQGVKIAYVNGDTLDAQYQWLKQQKEAIEQRMKSAEKSLSNEQESLMRDMNGLQERFAQGNMTQADAEKEQAALIKRRDRLAEKAANMEKQLAEDQKKAFNDLYANVEAKLKTLSSQIGYDYILSYSRGGQILLANDSLDITKQVLDLLNAEEKKAN